MTAVRTINGLVSLTASSKSVVQQKKLFCSNDAMFQSRIVGSATLFAQQIKGLLIIVIVSHLFTFLKTRLQRILGDWLY